MFKHYVNTKAEYTGICIYMFQNILTLLFKVFSLRDIKCYAFQKSTNFMWNITVKILLFKYFFLNSFFFTDEEFKVILTKYPKKTFNVNGIWKRYSFSRGHSHSYFNISASQYCRPPNNIEVLTIHPFALTFAFFRCGLWYCKYCHLSQNWYIFNQSFAIIFFWNFGYCSS